MADTRDGHKALHTERHGDTGKIRARCQCPGGQWHAPFRATALETIEDLARHWRGDSGHGTFYPKLCNLYWGSHGCDLVEGHAGTIHECGSRDEEGPCCQYNEAADPERRARWPEEFDAKDNVTTWGDWAPFSQAFR
jgi:hypothetical protein